MVDGKHCKYSECGNTFTPKRRTQIYCSRDCRIAAQYQWRKENREVCNEWEMAYRERNKEQVRLRNMARYRKNIEQKRARDRERSPEYRRKIRHAVIEHLGAKCIRCDFSDWRALQIDHINGNGTKEHAEKKSLTSFYRKVMASPPSVYQLLYANCNQIKRYENREGCGANSKPKRQK